MTGRGTPFMLFTLLALLSMSSHSQRGVPNHDLALGHQFTRPDSLKWVPSGGVQLAVLSGDPDKPGLFTIRLKIKDGYRVLAHWHPQDESITVVQGTFLMGMGDKFRSCCVGAIANRVDKIAEHLLGDFEVGDHPVFQWLYNSDLAWRTPQHFFGLSAHRLHFPSAVVKSNG